ncbi:Nucleobase cation symporter 2 family - like 9 [Theobroma cacao]|nr:Nucleobase cation symporter 2 family - like 9 [Theobroma cacao]
MAAPKPEEISHPPMDQLQGLEYCIDSNPSWGEAIALGFQHYILALGTAVMIPSFLVPLMGGTDRFLNTMRAVQGALIVASSIQIILGYSQMWAICSRFFSPLGMVPVIALVGFGLFDRGFPVVGRCVEIGIPMLILFIAFSQYLKNFLTKQLPILERFGLLISITVIWAYAHLLTASGAYKHRPQLTQLNCRTDKANLISSAPWIKIPYPLQWGAPTFDAGHAFGMMAAVLVSLIESTGAYKAASRLASATPPPAHVLSRGIGWQGIGILLDGLFGTLTGKFGALFASIPFTIFAAVYCVLFGLVASVGLSFLQFTNMNSMRNLFITGVALFLGLSVPEYFREYTAKALHGPAHTRGEWFNDFLNTIFFSSPTVALIIAVFLDNTLDYKDSARDRGMPWWVKFRTFKGDNRNEEFYTLPFNLNRFFPPS